MYQNYRFFKETDKIPMMQKTYFVADTHFDLKMIKFASNQAFSDLEKYLFLSNQSNSHAI
jgi:calcineurin-like phosphoesterase family protein